MSFILLFILAVLLLIPGIVMAVLPVPGALYMLVIAVIFGYVDGFVHLSGMDIGILTALALVTLLVDLVSGIMGARWGGSSWGSILWGLVGLVVGSVIIPIPIFGSLAGMFLGILAAEWYRTRDARLAHKAAAGSFLGWLAGAGFKVASGILFLILFLVFVLI